MKTVDKMGFPSNGLKSVFDNNCLISNRNGEEQANASPSSDNKVD